MKCLSRNCHRLSSNTEKLSGVALGSCLFFLVSVAPAAWPDSIWLKNGDHVAGIVQSIGDGKVAVLTEFAGTINIQLEHVEGIDTDEAIAVQGNDGVIEEGALRFDAGQTMVQEGQSDRTNLDGIKYAAIDEEALRKIVRKKERVWTGAVDAGAVFRSGESDRYDATFDIMLQRKRPEHTLDLKLSSSYGETDDSLNAQRLYGEAKWRYPFSSRPLFVFAAVTGEHDKLRKLEFRYTAASGVGYRFIENDRRNLSGEVGLEFAFERWDNFGIGERRDAISASRMDSFDSFQMLLDDLGSGEIPLGLGAVFSGLSILRGFADPNVGDATRDEEYPSGRIFLSYSEKLFQQSRLTNDLTLLPNFEDMGEFRLTNSFAFLTPISDRLYFRAQLRTEYDSDPGGEDVDEFDNNLSLGLRYTF